MTEKQLTELFKENIENHTRGENMEINTNTLKETNTWKDRLVEEYKQLKERYGKLKRWNTKQAILRSTTSMPVEEIYKWELTRDQQRTMGEYLHILELRMTNEGIEYED